MRIYVDTNIYLDLLLNRESNYLDFAAEARRLFDRAKQCEFEIILSDHIVNELFYASAGDLILSLQPKIFRVITTTADKREARKRADPYPDALHAVIAERTGAAVIVTRNRKDFQYTTCRVESPERL